jgi:hypothetical protein
VAPTLSGLSATTIFENGVTTLTGTITDPGTLDGLSLAVNWGDPRSPGNTETDTYSPSQAANGSQTFTLQHHYLDNPDGSPNGQFTIGLVVTDKDGGTSNASTMVTVKQRNADLVAAGPSPRAWKAPHRRSRPYSPERSPTPARSTVIP